MTWKGGPIFPGSWATGPTPVVEWQGQLVRGMEYWNSKAWGDFGAALIFAR